MTDRHRLTLTLPLGAARRDHISRRTRRLPHRRQIINLSRNRIKATSQRLQITNTVHLVDRSDETAPQLT
jgi:hypothetical protein